MRKDVDPTQAIHYSHFMNDSEMDTILGDDIKFRGSLKFNDRLKINGAFKGQIVTGGHLVIGESADVDADIEAGAISIYGKLRGNMTAKERIELMKNAEIRGDLRTPDLKIESGSRFTGSCIMD